MASGGETDEVDDLDSSESLEDPGHVDATEKELADLEHGEPESLEPEEWFDSINDNDSSDQSWE